MPTSIRNERILLKKVDELRVDEQGAPQTYYIAGYQRGYRWTPLQVTQLLNDIYEFTLRRNPQPDEFYCLQPVVVKNTSEGRFEVVDGQQRLTTLLLILRYFNERLTERFRMKLFTLIYETRASLNEFLDSPDENEAARNIDFLHLFKALRAIDTWFSEHESEVETIKAAFLNQTKVIWFELAAMDNPVDAFTRLNVGKIPLTNGELIRALFLREGRHEQSKISHVQTRIAHEWDLIEKSLQNDALWYFLSDRPGPTQNRIGYVFDLVAEMDGVAAGTIGDPYRVFNHFSDRLATHNAREAEWLRIKQIFMRLEEWFEDRNLFHTLGFLIHLGEPVSRLLNLAQDCAKDELERRLRELVFAGLFGEKPTELNPEMVAEKIDEVLATWRYDRQRNRIRLLLLLFNVATLLENDASNIRFQFDSFKKGEWDIEHVRSISADDVNTVARRRDWLIEVKSYFEAQNSHDQLRAQIDLYLGYEDPRSRVEEFISLYEEIVQQFGERTEQEPDHTIGNLVLLDTNTNRSYKNAVFALKRRRLLELDRAGIFLPLCTRNVFLKCYRDIVDNALFWSDLDRDAYLLAMRRTLINFFTNRTETVQ